MVALSDPSSPQTSAPSTDPTETDLRILCAAGHGWTERWSLPMTLDAFERRMEAVLTCPICGATTFCAWAKEAAHG